MMKNDEEKILKMFSDVLSDSEIKKLRNDLDNTDELKKFSSKLENELNEMKEVYQNYPGQNYFNNLSNTVFRKVEEKKSPVFQPSFAYALAIAIVVFIASQLMNFNINNFNLEYASLFDASDIEEYISIDQYLNYNTFADVLLSDANEFDYAEYLLNNSNQSEIFKASAEGEILNLLDESIEDAIINELAKKKIL